MTKRYNHIVKKGKGVSRSVLFSCSDIVRGLLIVLTDIVGIEPRTVVATRPLDRFSNMTEIIVPSKSPLVL